MRDFKFTEQERPTMANFNARFDAIAALANGLGNEYVWLRNDGTYVNSPDSSAYPPAVPDGYTYTALGQLGNKVQIATGSYVGTGTHGISNPNSLTFEFEPKILIIKKESTDARDFIAINGVSSITTYQGNMVNTNKITWNANTISWYNIGDSFADAQMNYNNALYYYIAIG